MIYEVTSYAKQLSGMKARVRVDDADGLVRSIYCEGKEMVATMNYLLSDMKMMEHLPWNAVHAALDNAGLFRIEECKEKPKEEVPTNAKLSMWCSTYVRLKGVKYKVTGPDSGKMKSLAITQELLDFYLDDSKLPDNSTTWLFKGKQSIGNLAKYWNEVRTAMATPQVGKSKHPNYWSPEHLRKLDGPSIGEYHKHLKSLGLVPRNYRDGSIIDYVPNASTHS